MEKDWEIFDLSGDVGIEVRAPDLGAAFAALTEGFTALVTDPAAVEAGTTRELLVEGSDLAALAVNWLNELIFLLDARGFLPCRARIRSAGPERIEADLEGDTFDPKRHERRLLVKAATFHDVLAREEPGGFRLRVVLDL